MFVIHGFGQAKRLCCLGLHCVIDRKTCQSAIVCNHLPPQGAKKNWHAEVLGRTCETFPSELWFLCVFSFPNA